MQTFRPRRLRRSAAMRELVKQTTVTVNDLIAPLFVQNGNRKSTPISSMPGQNRLSVDLLVEKALELHKLGLKGVALFPAIEDSLKTSDAAHALDENGLYPRAIKAVKEACPDLLIMSDVALDPYSSDGHDGLVDASTGRILNDETLPVLAQMALLQAKCGSDIIGPSDMMDGRIGHIRDVLDEHAFQDVCIMSYSAKYASSFYGPFRDALDSAPKKGDKKTYQMDYSNSDEAVREMLLDESEGADIVMVKPGLSYLDVIYRLKQSTLLPVAAYNVSGEYAMVKAAAQMGWVDGEKIMVEMLTSFKRAGADIILTYFAEEMARYLQIE